MLNNKEIGQVVSTGTHSGRGRGLAIREYPRVKPVIRWAFYAFVFSILFEALPIGLPLELTQITGGILVITTLLQPHICFRRPPTEMWYFMLYLCIGIVSLLWASALFQKEMIWHLFVLLQLIVLFWISFNLMRHERVARGALLSLVASCLTLSILSVFGLTITTISARRFGARLAVFGLDPNQLAGVLTLGLLALIGFAYGLNKSAIKFRLLAGPAVVLIGITIVKTGSRGGLVALVAGLMFFVLKKGTLLVKARNALIALAVAGLFFWIAYQSETIRLRFEKTVEAGDMTARDRIYPAAWQMFLEKPVIGWGPRNNAAELGARVRMPGYQYLDTHNLILYILTATGLAGAIPFLIGTALCVSSAWRARGGPHGAAPVALIFASLIANLSVSGLEWKQFWLILAYGLAAGKLRLARGSRHIGTGTNLAVARHDRQPLVRPSYPTHSIRRKVPTGGSNYVSAPPPSQRPASLLKGDSIRSGQ